MPVLDWRRHRPKGGDLAFTPDAGTAVSWEEAWDVIEYVPPTGEPAWFGLIVDRPDLAPGQLHPVITSAYVTKFDPKPLGTSKGWTVTVGYRIGDPKGLDLPPLDRPAVIDVTTESVEVPAYRMADGTPWINTAGDLLAGVTRKKNRVIFNIKKNVSAVPAWSLTYQNSVNSDAIAIRGLAIAAGFGALGDLAFGNTVPEVVNGIAYNFIPASYTITYDPEGWIEKHFNAGLYQIKSGKYVPCVDDDGEPVTEPAFLDAAGLQLPYPVNPASIITVEGFNQNQMPYSAIPLS